MTQDNKKITIGIVALIIIIIIIAAAVYNHNKKVAQQNTATSQQTAIAPSSSINNNATTTSSSNSAPTSKKLTYAQAIVAYPNRFQFSNQCQGTPAVIAVRQNTPVMLDNRNSGPITLTADGQTFKIPGYNYVVFYPSRVANIPVTCDGKNSVTLNVEK